MPYVERDLNGKVCTLLLNQTDENSEWLDDNNEEVLYFNLKLDLLSGLKEELESRNNTVVIDAITWDLVGPYSRIFAINVMEAHDTGVTEVNLPDAVGVFHPYTPENAKTLSSNLSTYASGLYSNYSSLKISIMMSPNYTSLQAIDITSGWPVAP